MAEVGKTSGADILLKIGANIVAGQSSLDLDRAMDTIETTTKDNGGWKTYIGSLKSWSVACDGAIVFGAESFTALETAFNACQEIDVEIAVPGNMKYAGKALITSFPISAPYDDKATYSLSLQGTGALTSGVVSSMSIKA